MRNAPGPLARTPSPSGSPGSTSLSLLVTSGRWLTELDGAVLRLEPGPAMAFGSGRAVPVSVRPGADADGAEDRVVDRLGEAAEAASDVPHAVNAKLAVTTMTPAARRKPPAETLW